MRSSPILHGLLTDSILSIRNIPKLGAQVSSSVKIDEDGFILVSTLVVLVLLVILGISTTTNTNIELQIAGNDKVYKQNFSVAEGGSYIEAGKVGVSTSPYEVSDPSNSDQILTVIPNPAQFIASDISTWPTSNFNPLTYSSLVTYLYAATAPKGYDASKFSSYKFKINGANVNGGNVVIELGGSKVGAKSSM